MRALNMPLLTRCLSPFWHRRAIRIAGDVTTKGLVDLGVRIDAEDASGVVVYSLPFSGTVAIIPEASRA
jgi:hypothetical protein